jgi:hypothetical protein
VRPCETGVSVLSFPPCDTVARCGLAPASELSFVITTAVPMLLVFGSDLTAQRRTGVCDGTRRSPEDRDEDGSAHGCNSGPRQPQQRRVGRCLSKDYALRVLAAGADAGARHLTLELAECRRRIVPTTATERRMSSCFDLCSSSGLVGHRLLCVRFPLSRMTSDALDVSAVRHRRGGGLGRARRAHTVGGERCRRMTGGATLTGMHCGTLFFSNFSPKIRLPPNQIMPIASTGVLSGFCPTDGPLRVAALVPVGTSTLIV